MKIKDLKINQKTKIMKTFITFLVGFTVGIFIAYFSFKKYEANFSVYTISNSYHIEGLRIYDEVGNYDITFKSMESLDYWIGQKTAEESDCTYYCLMQ